jgi:hypothetical protein
MSRFLNKNLELLEPYDAKVSRTVLRGESSRKGADLLDFNFKIVNLSIWQFQIGIFRYGYFLVS